MTPTDDLHYRSELVESLTRLQNIWSDPAFGRRMARVRDHGFSSMEVRVLWTIGSRGPMRGSVLAELIGTGAPTVSKTIAKLEQRGLVVRDRDERDARAHDVRLTDEGRRLAHELYAAGDDMMDELLAGWDESDIAAFTGYVARLVGRAQSFSDSLDASRTTS
jgi:DNA-binding MarR family transcriptional regulator